MPRSRDGRRQPQGAPHGAAYKGPKFKLTSVQPRGVPCQPRATVCQPQAAGRQPQAACWPQVTSGQDWTCQPQAAMGHWDHQCGWGAFALA